MNRHQRYVKALDGAYSIRPSLSLPSGVSATSEGTRILLTIPSSTSDKENWMLALKEPIAHDIIEVLRFITSEV